MTPCNRCLRIATGALLLSAPGLRAVSAAEVYEGCAVPPAKYNHIWYVDSVNGKTQADGGDGSKAHPWNSLQAAFSVQPGYKTPLLSTSPYRHPNPNPGGKPFWAGPPVGPINPGDQIQLMTGNYGRIEIGGYGYGIPNPSFVSIAAAPGQTPVLDMIWINGSSKFVFSGLKVEHLADGTGRSIKEALVGVHDQGADLPTSDILFTKMLIQSTDDATDFTQEQWNHQIKNDGFYTRGAYVTCVSMNDSHIRNVVFGATLQSDNTLFTRNEIDHFGDDGIDYRASNQLYTKNYIHDVFDIGTGNHPDGMQGYPGDFHNVVIDSNRVIRLTDPRIKFPNWMQGIDAFDGDWHDMRVSNNVVVTSACWGIVLGSVHGGQIINNTVFSDELMKTAGNCKPVVAIGDKSHEGSSSNDVVVRNNLTNGLKKLTSAPTVTMDHNICVGIGGACGIFTIKDGKPNYGDWKPGTYGDHNVVDARGVDRQVLGFDPARQVFDLRLRPFSGAIGAGNPDGAPPLDITGAARTKPIDVGAYKFEGGK